ncbi:MAG: response regulator transcription factor [Granulosicoccus sp.]|nr:response regulator transcription factor [Granulosicoccus sp.]
MRILLIEDDSVISGYISKGMRESGHSVLSANDGLQGLDYALNEEFDVAIIDLMLPCLDGLSIIQKMRKRNRNTPVIILSAKRSVDDRVAGLRKGGDDYLTKPFSFTELLARVEALTRRAADSLPDTEIELADLKMDLMSRRVTRAGRRIDLQPKEFALLEYLIRNAGNVVSKTMIMERVWNYNFDPCTNIVEARISKLREKIDKNFEFPLIHTVRGVGYVLRSSVEG